MRSLWAVVSLRLLQYQEIYTNVSWNSNVCSWVLWSWRQSSTDIFYLKLSLSYLGSSELLSLSKLVLTHWVHGRTWEDWAREVESLAWTLTLIGATKRLLCSVILFSIVCVWGVYACDSRCPRSPEMWGSLGAGVKVVVTCLVWMLVTKLGFSGQTESSFNYWALSSLAFLSFKHLFESDFHHLKFTALSLINNSLKFCITKILNLYCWLLLQLILSGE